jgi:adenylate kinase family enzyme
MPVLGASDGLPGQPHRVLVAGTSGAGKSTLARAIAGRLELPYVEIDSLFHGPGWTERGSFDADVERFSAQPRWVTEWQYPAVRAMLAERADLMVWLDLPRWTVMRQVVGRTVRRRLRREQLWAGNLEPPFRTILTDREHIVRWAWTSHGRGAQRVMSLAEARPELPIVRLRSREAAAGWLCALPCHRPSP